jgi:hypothetical protein
MFSRPPHTFLDGRRTPVLFQVKKNECTPETEYPSEAMSCRGALQLKSCFCSGNVSCDSACRVVGRANRMNMICWFVGYQFLDARQISSYRKTCHSLASILMIPLLHLGGCCIVSRTPNSSFLHHRTAHRLSPAVSDLCRLQQYPDTPWIICSLS